MFPLTEQLFSLLEDDLFMYQVRLSLFLLWVLRRCFATANSHSNCAYLLLSRIADVLVGIEQRANVDGLTSPERSLDTPVK